MKNLLNPEGIAGQQEEVTLQQMVSRLVAGSLPAAVWNKSFMINDVPTGMRLIGNTDMVAMILSNLFNTVVKHVENSCIRISAKSYSDVKLFQLRDRNCTNRLTIANSFQEAKPIAEKIGRYIGITSQRKSETTIVFSFPNLPVAA
jgi:hypothetical protein